MSDIKKIIGVVMLVGSAPAIGNAYFGNENIEPTISEALEVAASMVIGFTLLFCGWSAIRWQKLTPETMKVIDLIWIIFSAIGVIFGLSQALIETSNETRESLERNIEISKKKSIVELEYLVNVGCPAGVVDKDKCQWIRTIYGNLKSGQDINEFIIGKICPKPPIDLSKPNLPSDLLPACLDLEYVALIPKMPVMQDKENVNHYKLLYMVFGVFIAMAIGLRISKSFSEVWLIK